MGLAARFGVVGGGRTTIQYRGKAVPPFRYRRVERVRFTRILPCENPSVCPKGADVRHVKAPYSSSSVPPQRPLSWTDDQAPYLLVRDQPSCTEY